MSSVIPSHLKKPTMEYQTIKIHKETLAKLRLLAGITETPMLTIISQAVSKALSKEKGKRNGVNS